MRNYVRIPTAVLDVLAVAVICFGVVAACATPAIPPPQTPSQAVFAAKGTFLIALGRANDYKALPPCPTVIVCSSTAVVAVLQKVANSTNIALDAADATVNDPAFKDSDAAGKAAAAAKSAVTALQAITDGLRIR